MSYYQTLGVTEQATNDEIKKAYRKLSKQYHPDVNPNGDTQFKQVAEAYSVIGDEDKRRNYDAKQSNNNFFSSYGQNVDFSSLFDQMFSNSHQTNTAQKGPDMPVEIHVSFGEAFNGTSKSFNLSDGNIQMNFKPGLKTGQKFRVQGRGHRHPYNTTLPKGDLVVTISVIPDSRFILQDNDIWIEVTAHWWSIIAGTKIPITTPEGQLILKIPKGTNPGKTLRIQDKGFPIYGTDSRGSILCRVNASYPELNDEQLEYIDKIKQLSNGK